MPTATLNRDEVQIKDDLASIVVVKDLGDIPGGRTLDVTDLAASGGKIVKSGHVIVRDTSSGDFSPLGVSDGAYVSLPEGKAYAGVLKSSVLVIDPRAAILTAGQVNAAASPYPVTDEIIKGLPNIQFLYA